MVLIEMDLKGKFLEEIVLKDEIGCWLEQKVNYEWELVKCENCNKIGHGKIECRDEYNKKVCQEKIGEGQTVEEGGDGKPDEVGKGDLEGTVSSEEAGQLKDTSKWRLLR